VIFGQGAGSRRLLTRSPAARQMMHGHLLGVFQARKGVRKGETAPRAPTACRWEKVSFAHLAPSKRHQNTAAFGVGLLHPVHEDAHATGDARNLSQGAKGSGRGAANCQFAPTIFVHFCFSRPDI